MSILPRFLVLEMIADMSPIDEYLPPQQLHKIYIHHYKDVRYNPTNRWRIKTDGDRKERIRHKTRRNPTSTT